MSLSLASAAAAEPSSDRRRSSRIALKAVGARAFYPVAGLAALLGLWWLGGAIVASNPATRAFAGFGPGPAFAALADILISGRAWTWIWASLYRIGVGLGWAIAIGLPLGIAIGRSAPVRQFTHTPFQFLRMISPLAWMPIAVLAFRTWDGAIVFLIAAAAVWPVMFATAHGLRRIDPHWFTIARNLGGRGLQMLRLILLPAVMQDVLTGVRLALGVAWIVLVPAEYLGVTSGLGYAINDARDTLEYDRLAAIVIMIGAIGLLLDGICVALIRRYRWHDDAEA